MFADTVNSYVSKNIITSEKMEFDFSRIQFQIFPPATIFEGVRISQEGEYEINAAEVGAYFGLMDFFSSQFTIGNLKISNGMVGIRKLDFSESKHEYHVYDDIKKANKNLPVNIRSIELENISLKGKKDSISVDTLELSFYKNFVDFAGEVENVSIDELVGYKVGILDSIKFNFEINKKNVRVRNMELQKNLEKLRIFGEVDSGLRNFELEYSTHFHLGPNLKKYTDLKEDVLRDIGDADTFLKGKIQILEGSSRTQNSIEFHNYNSPLFLVPSIKSKFVTEGEEIIVKTFEASFKKGDIKLAREYRSTLEDMQEIRINGVEFRLNSIFSNNILYFLGPSFNKLKANFSGTGIADFNTKEIDIKFNNDFLSRGTHVINNGARVVDFGELLGREFKINYSFETEDLYIDGVFSKEKMKLPFELSLIDERLKFRTNEGYLSFTEIGNISGVETVGEGPGNIFVDSNIDEIEMNITGNFTDAKVKDFYLGNISTDFLYNFNSKKINISRLHSKFNSTEYSGKAIFDFEKRAKVNLSIDLKQTDYSDLQKMVPTLIPEALKNIYGLTFSLNGDVVANGEIGNNKLKANFKGRGKRLNYIREFMDQFKFNLMLEDGVVKLDDLVIQKNTGLIVYGISFNTKTRFFEYDAKVSNFNLMDLEFYKALELGLEGKIHGEFYGSGTWKEFNSRSVLELKNSRVGRNRLKNSKLSFFNNEKEVFASGNLFGDYGVLDSYLDLKGLGNKSYFNLNAKVDDVRPVLGAISIHNLSHKNLTGGFQGKLFSKFNYKRPYELDLEASVSKAEVYFGNNWLKVKPEHSKILIEKGFVKNWDVLFFGSDNSMISSKASGSLVNDFELVNSGGSSSKWANLFSDKFKNTKGRIFGDIKVRKKGESWTTFGESTIESVSTELAKVNGEVSEISGKVFLEDNKLIISEVNGNYGNGKIGVDGKMIFKVPFPNINIKIEYKDVFYSLFKKSSVTSSGSLRFSGEKIPYRLSGDISIDNSLIRESFEDLSKSFNQSTSYNRFIPTTAFRNRFDFIEFDLNAATKAPFSLQNSLVNLRFDAGVEIGGDYYTPLFKGLVKAVNNKSIIFFKGHEFMISRGDIKLRDSIQKEKPFLSFRGEAKVNIYSVFLKVDGEIDNLKIELSSEPALSQGDILSLLTLGITSDQSENLGETDRQSLTTMTLGSFVFDQLQLTKGFDSKLGVKLSIAPEFNDDSDNLIESKSADTKNSVKRVKTSTKVQVEKRLSKNADVKLSSTLGADSEQKQEIKLNYKVNDKVSLEGIYETKTSEENIDEQSSSAGADLIFRWKF